MTKECSDKINSLVWVLDLSRPWKSRIWDGLAIPMGNRLWRILDADRGIRIGDALGVVRWWT